MKKFSTIERNLRTPRQETNLSTFSFLFSEYLQLLKRKHGSDYNLIQDKLEKLGQTVGVRLNEIVSLRESRKREAKILEQLKYVQGPFWKAVFGKQSDSLERLKDRPNDYLIRDDNPLLLRYVGEESGISPASFMVGILQGVFESSGFTCTIYYEFRKEEKTSYYPQTIFIISFDESSIKKENL